MLDLHRLTTFRAVVLDGTITGAARSLGYTPSAVSQQLQALQREAGLTLFERSGRGVVPTSAGRRLFDEASAVLQESARLDGVVADLRDGRTGTLSLSHTTSVGLAWVPQVAARLSEEFPDLRLDLRLWEITRDADWDPDVEICVEDDVATTPPDRDRVSLLTESYVAVLSRGHALASESAVSLSQLAEEAWVDNDVSNGPCRRILLNACAAVGFTPRFRLETQDHAPAVAFVAAGGGVTVLPRLCFATAARGSDDVVALDILDPAPQRTLVAQIRRSRRGHPGLERMVELFLEQGRLGAGEGSIGAPVRCQ